MNVKEKLLVCERCGSVYFEPVYLLYKVSKVESQDGKEGLAPIDIFKCADCGNVNKEFLQEKNDETENASSIIMS